MSNFKIIFVHGWQSSSQFNWYPYISKQLEKLGIDFSVPDLPGGTHPQASEWVKEIHRVVLQTKKQLVLIGHSLGTRAILLYLEKHRVKIKEVILIAAFANRVENAVRREGNYASFFDHKIDLEKIKPLVDKFVVVHSQNDAALDYTQGVKIAKDLGAELITHTNNDHFRDPESGPEILKILRQELAF